MRTITVFGAGALAVALAGSAPAEAQLVLMEGQCHGAAPCETVGEECPDNGVCVTVGESSPFCISRTAVPCCNAENPCPSFDGVALECMAITGLTTAAGGEVASLCLEPRPYCEDTLEGVRQCHTESDLSTVRSSFVDGDCDRDGLSNGEEMAIGSNHCEPPLRRGVDVGDSCVAVQSLCSLEEPCTLSDGDAGECNLTEDGNGTRCMALEEGSELFCASEIFDCAPGELIVTVRDRDFCAPPRCVEADIDIEDCIRDDTGEPVPFAEGDCDRDEVTNGAEKLAMTDPCVAPGDEDAGATEDDAGPEPMEDDAGEVAMDAGGDAINPRFEGGGGCSCRASGGSRGSAIGLGGLVALALLARRRR